ncbi:MAG: SusC/RagA family TonB-linked outer membrane protein [Marinifilaceae bacterium]
MSMCVLFTFLQVSAQGVTRKDMIVFPKQQLSVEQVFDVISQQLKVDVFYSENELNSKRLVQLPNKQMEMDEVMKNVLGEKMSFKIQGNAIVIQPQKNVVSKSGPEMVKVSGVIKDSSKEALPGVTIMLKGTTIGTTTDIDGKYELEIPKNTTIVLQYSFIGMVTKEIAWKGEKTIDVMMQEDAAEMEEVVVTGFFERKAESFTGSASTYRAKDLKMVGKQSVLSSLRTLDPSFNIKESTEFGSDPNRLPNMEVRGKTSVVGLQQEYAQDPNQPLFILDGFETSLSRIVDLNMERVESITVLKDAASTAIYGSKAANGVIVIETKRPEPGKLKVSYTGDFSLTMPDLSVYNLMNASEKLEFERLAGVYSQNSQYVKPDPDTQWQLTDLYNKRLHKVKSGVDTYWLSEPVRTGIVHKHNLYLEGGDDAMRYGAGVSYAGTQGVMYDSKRDVFSGNISLIYRKKTFSFTNQLTIDYVMFEDPQVDFSSYAAASPYYNKYSSDGSVPSMLEWETQGNPAMKNIYNPIWDSKQNNLHSGHNIGITENLNFDWTLATALRLRGRFGLVKGINVKEDFISPFNSTFAKVNDVNKRGSYVKTTDNNWSYNGDLTLTYGDVLNEVHRVNFVGGWTFRDDTGENESYNVIGFPVDDIQNPSFGNSYKPDSKAHFYRSKGRSTSFFVNGGYAFNERYLLDANLRLDGASIFGSNKRFTNTWSTGLSWNVHNEPFMMNAENVNMLKLRASIGNPGNQNFGGYNSYTTYVYHTGLNNTNGIGAVVSGYGNPDLEWQKTLDLNVGLDLTFFKNRFKVTLDAYRKRTDPLLVETTVSSSTGSNIYVTNLGHQTTLGMSANLFYSIIQKPVEDINWTINANFRRQKAELGGIGNKLESLNNDSQAGGGSTSTALRRYYDGADPEALWAVRSAGIDPMTGKEVFIKKNGERTFEHDTDDEVMIGVGAPKFEGVLGTTLYYKGFSASVYCRYKIGEYKFNSALYNKVENITRDTWTTNQDKRALYNRWQKPGDKAEFKGIGLVDEVSPMSSRFIQKENVISGESFSVGYDFTGKPWLDVLGLRVLNVRAYMNDIFRISNVKMERGTSYPFARTVSFSLSANFK